MPVLGFIGTGNMGGALARSAAQSGGNKLLLANRRREKAAALAAEIGGDVVDNEAAATASDYLFLGVKPHLLPGVLAGLRDTLAARKDRFVLVSMAAGVEISRVQALSGGAWPVIRIMPNTPCAIGEGMTLYACSENVTAEEEQAFLSAMRHAGRFAKLEERLIDAGSAVSGCGPAFVDLFVEAMADGGVACGLPRAQALEFAAQMTVGAARLILETGDHPGALKDAVCSPGGSTIQGVRALESAAFRAAIMNAVIAAYEKTAALGK